MCMQRNPAYDLSMPSQPMNRRNRGRRPAAGQSDGLDHLTPVRAQAFIGLLRAAERLDRELDARLQKTHDLSLRAFEVLLHLAVFAPDRHLRITDLAEQAPLSQSQVSRLVTELEGRAMVKRSSVAGDRRGTEVTITTVGLDAFRSAQRTHLRDLDQRLFSRLTETEISQLARITTKILNDQPTGPAA